jgi:hypothetical protein
MIAGEESDQRTHDESQSLSGRADKSGGDAGSVLETNQGREKLLTWLHNYRSLVKGSKTPPGQVEGDAFTSGRGRDIGKLCESMIPYQRSRFNGNMYL